MFAQGDQHENLGGFSGVCDCEDKLGVDPFVCAIEWVIPT